MGNAISRAVMISADKGPIKPSPNTMGENKTLTKLNICIVQPKSGFEKIKYYPKL
jgi:hypothetical protein